MDADQFWHARGWWRDPEYNDWGTYSAGYREQILRSLAAVFDEPWYQSIGQRHPILLYLHGKGVWPYDHLLDLADACHSVLSAKLLNKDLSKNLKSREHFLGAYFELQVLARLIKAGFSPKRPSTKGKNADFLIQKNPDIYLEIKSPKIARENQDISDLEIAMLHSLHLYIPAGIKYELKLGTNIKDLLETREGIKKIKASFPKWRTELAQHLQTAVQAKSWEKELGTPGFFTFVLSENGKDTMGGNFDGAPAMLKYEVDKICENAIGKARQQIPSDAAGLVIIRSQYVADSMVQGIEDYLVSEDLKHISMVILCQRHYAWAVTTDTLTIPNPKAKVNIGDSKIVEALANWE